MLSKRRSAAARAADLRGAAPLFAALGDETRLRLVSRLCASGPMSIVRLTEGSDVTRQAVAKHLRVLEDAGLVHSERHGRESLWRLDPRSVEHARKLLDGISRDWDDALERLRSLVEDEDPAE